MSRKLTSRQAAFCRHYITGISATEAARAAGYSHTYADRQANQLLENPRVKEFLAELAQQVNAEAIMTAEEVLQEYSKLGRANLLDYFHLTSTGEPVIDLSSVTPEQAAALAEIQVEDYLDGRGEDARDVRRIRIKLGDKKGALDSLARHHKLLTDNVHVSGSLARREDVSNLSPEELVAAYHGERKSSA